MFNINYAFKVFILASKFLNVTLTLTLYSMIIGFTIALIISFLNYLNIKSLNRFLKFYISLLRGTPLLMQMFFIYFGLPQFFPSLNTMTAFSAAVISMGINSSAYMSETLRGAIQSIDIGQKEAGYSCGMSEFQIFSRVIFPQAFRVAVAPLMNTLINLLKNSSIAYTIGVMEVMSVVQSEGASSYNYFEAFFSGMLIYWILVLILQFMQTHLEKKLIYHGLVCDENETSDYRFDLSKS